MGFVDRLQINEAEEAIKGIKKSEDLYQKLSVAKKSFDTISKFHRDIKNQAERGNISGLRATLQNTNLNYQQNMDEIQSFINLTGSEIDDIVKFNQQHKIKFEKVKSHLQNTGELIDNEAVTKSSDIWHRIILTGLRCIQIFVFITITYLSVAFAAWLVNHQNLVIPRGLINIVPSEALSIQPHDVQSAEPEKAQ